MKILFVAATNSLVNFKNINEPQYESNDNLTDSLFLEAKSRYSDTVYECPWMPHMYKDSPTEEHRLHGRGFGLHKRLKQTPNILKVNECIEMIENKFFDLIFTDARTHSDWWNSRGLSPFYSDAVKIKESFLKSYPKNKIIFLDGEDQSNKIYTEFIDKSLYFKREQHTFNKSIHPIEYCLPKENMLEIKSVDEKKRMIATYIPMKFSKYIFEKEDEYYEDYRTSFFGVTWKKLGWTCPRHCEIIFSSCVPVFPDIEECPENTLTFYPKELCKKILKSDFVKNSKHYRYQPYHDLYGYADFEFEMNNSQEYMDYLHQFKEHALKYLTTEKMFNYILNHV
jgi:hypothetical protein